MIWQGTRNGATCFAFWLNKFTLFTFVFILLNLFSLYRTNMVSLDVDFFPHFLRFCSFMDVCAVVVTMCYPCYGLLNRMDSASVLHLNHLYSFLSVLINNIAIVNIPNPTAGTSYSMYRSDAKQKNWLSSKYWHIERKKNSCSDKRKIYLPTDIHAR